MSNPVSCVECQRRKQKCSRVFPCNHCSKRGVAHLCRFVSARGNDQGHSFESQEKPSLKRKNGPIDDVVAIDDSGPFDAANELAALGYMSDKLSVEAVIEPCTTEKESEDLRTALQAVPPKPYTDCLVHNFLNGANYQYFSIYPPQFLGQYEDWWANRSTGKSVTCGLTCLILRVCACSAQWIMFDSVRRRLESELGVSLQALTERLHTSATKLSASIPPGRGGLTQVQQLFLSAFWFKAEEQWIDSWHSLSSAIREAQEIGLHRDDLSQGVSEFDQETRRRLWILLFTWDWQMSALLSRPLMINYAACSFTPPNLGLEASAREPGLPSPYSHIAYEFNLIQDLAAKFSIAAKELGAEKAAAIQAEVEKWMDSLPAVYQRRSPDTRWDEKHYWIRFQRHHIHVVGFMASLGPVKQYLVSRPGSSGRSELEKSLLASGVSCCLELLDNSRKLFESVTYVSSKFHFGVFCVFDTATVLCSAILHDIDGDLPDRPAAVDAIAAALRMVDRVNIETGGYGALCRILRRLLESLPLTAAERSGLGGAGEAPKRVRTVDTSSPESDRTRVDSSQGDAPWGVDPGMAAVGRVPPSGEPAPLDPAFGSRQAFPNDLDGGVSYDLDGGVSYDLLNIGGIGALWDWETLDLGTPGPLSEDPSRPVPRLP